MEPVPRKPPERWVKKQNQSRSGGIKILGQTDAVQNFEDSLPERFGTRRGPQEELHLTALSTNLFCTRTVVYVPGDIDAEDVAIRVEQTPARCSTALRSSSPRSRSPVTRFSTASPRQKRPSSTAFGVVRVAAGEGSSVRTATRRTSRGPATSWSKRGVAKGTYDVGDWIESRPPVPSERTEVSDDPRGDIEAFQIVRAFCSHNDQHFDLGEGRPRRTTMRPRHRENHRRHRPFGLRTSGRRHRRLGHEALTSARTR